MSRKVLIIAEASASFTINKIRDRLEEESWTVDFLQPKDSEIKSVSDSPEFMIVYIDFANSREAVFHAIDDYAADNPTRIAVIGKTEELDEVRGCVGDGRIWKYYERPVNTSVLVEDMIAETGSPAGDAGASEAGGSGQEDSAQSGSAGTASSSRKKVLLIDDSAMTLKMIKAWISGSYDVETADGAASAAELLKTLKPDLILLDYEMPVCSGPEYYKQLKADAATASIPVIFMTGAADPESLAVITGLEPEGRLFKNMAPGEVVAGIDHYFATGERNY